MHVIHRNCGSSVAVDQTERIRLIQSSSLFTGLPAAEITRLALYARHRCFARNELLFMQGGPMHTLVLMKSGWVKVTQSSLHGSEVILATRSAGEIVDLPTGSGIDHHTVSAKAAVECTAITWAYPTVRDLVTTALFNSNLCAVLSKQHYELQDRYHEMSTDKVERRVACTILRLAKQCGTHTHAGVEVCVSRQDLALMTGTTLFAVSRLISKWSKDRLIAAGREVFLMLDAEGLESMTSAEKTVEKATGFRAMRKTQGRGTGAAVLLGIGPFLT